MGNFTERPTSNLDIATASLDAKVIAAACREKGWSLSIYHADLQMC